MGGTGSHRFERKSFAFRKSDTGYTLHTCTLYLLKVHFISLHTSYKMHTFTLSKFIYAYKHWLQPYKHGFSKHIQYISDIAFFCLSN